MIQFYDAVIPVHIPGRDYAALYFDGTYGQVGQMAARLFGHCRWITVTGDFEHCGIADFEEGNPVFDTPELLAEYLKGRAALYNGRGRRGRIYCDRANAAKALYYAGDAPREWWIATLDNRDWSASQLARDLAENWDAKIPATEIWANQNVPGQRYDTSNLLRSW